MSSETKRLTGETASVSASSAVTERDCLQAGGPGTPPRPTRRTPLTYEAGFQCISFRWLRDEEADFYKIEASYDGGPVFAPVTGAEKLEGASHQLPVRYWNIGWGRTVYRLRSCGSPDRPYAILGGRKPDTARPAHGAAHTGRCRTIASVALAPEDATKASRAIKMPLAGLLDKPGVDIPLGSLFAKPGANDWVGQQDGADLLLRSQSSSWEGHNHWTGYPRGAHSLYSAIALSADRGSLALLAVGRWSRVERITLHSARPQGWRPDLVVPISGHKAGIPDIGDARLLPLFPPSPRGVSTAGHAVHEILLSANGDTFAASLRNAPAMPLHNVRIAPTAFPGAVVILHKDGEGWRHQGLLQPPSLEDKAGFGTGLAMSADGNTLFAGAPGETVLAERSGGAVIEAGAVYQFVRRSGLWRQQAKLTARVPRPLERMGHAIALSADGRTLAVGTQSAKAAQVYALVRTHLAPGEPTSDEPAPTGAVHIFSLAGGKWVHSEVVRPDTPEADGAFGEAVSLSADGSVLAVGAPSRRRDKKLKGMVGAGIGTMSLSEKDEALVATPSATYAIESGNSPGGAAYVFGLEDGRWRQKTRIDPPGLYLKLFGLRVSLDSRGRTLFVRAVERDIQDLERLYGSQPIEGAPAENDETAGVLYYVY